MNELSGLSSAHKLTSQRQVSLESTQKSTPLEATGEMKEIKQLEIDLVRFNDAMQLAQQIRSSLESALRDLS